MDSIKFSNDSGVFTLGWSFDGDYIVALAVKAHGFRGHSDGHVEKVGFEAFAKQIVALDATRKGEAVLHSAIPGDFECRVRSIDSSGHLGVFGVLSGDHERCGKQKLEFSLDFEPSQIEKASRACRDIAT